MTFSKSQKPVAMTQSTRVHVREFWPMFGRYQPNTIGSQTGRKRRIPNTNVLTTIPLIELSLASTPFSKLKMITSLKPFTENATTDMDPCPLNNHKLKVETMNTCCDVASAHRCMWSAWFHREYTTPLWADTETEEKSETAVRFLLLVCRDSD
jgi:hypothetical protein